MPLHDHFHPPWSVRRPWEGFHAAWAGAIAFDLNGGVLPPDYYAMPLLQTGGRIEVDVATFAESVGQAGAPTPRNGNAGRDAEAWSPPAPAGTLTLEPAEPDTFAVHVMRNFGGPQLRAAIELVSPANKDRETSRRAFAAKCAGHLRRGVSVVVVDVVTERSANLHADILAALESDVGRVWRPAGGLYAVAYRGLAVSPPRVELWTHELAVGAALPELPLWLEPDLCVPLRLEQSYQVTCGSLRMGG